MPFKVPVYDEDSSLLQEQAYKKAKNDQPEKTFEKPKPVYQWAYRPELQFSIYDLMVDEIRREDADDNSQDVLKDDKPVLTSSDAFLKILYDLQTNANDPLEAYSYDGDRELVFALGEQELKATVSQGAGEHQKLEFDDLSALSGLEPEDYLSLRLYTNNDAGNILWEWAFGNLSLIPGRDTRLSEQENTVELTADEVAEGPLSVNAYLTGSFDDGLYEPVYWGLEGSGSLSKVIATSDNGIYNTSLSLPTRIAEPVTVYGQLTREGRKTFSTTFKVLPGIASDIWIANKTGKTAIGGLGTVEWTLEVRDAYGNKVPDGTEVSVVASEVSVTSVAAVKDGRASITLSGEDLPGDHEVIVTTGQAIMKEKVKVHEVTLELPDITDVQIRRDQQFTIQANTRYGSLKGLAIDVAVHRGKLNTARVVLDHNNQATVTYSSGQYRGFAQLSAKVSGTRSFVSESFYVVGPGNYFAAPVSASNQAASTKDSGSIIAGSFLSSHVLVTDGSGSIDLGNGKTLNYGNSTELNLQGSPGEELSSSLGNIFAPPVYALQDYNVERGAAISDTIFDISSGIDANVKNVEAVDINLSKYTASWKLQHKNDDEIDNQPAFISIPEHYRTSDLKEAGINFWLNFPSLSNLSSAVTLVDWDDYGLQLLVKPDQTLTLIAQSAQGQVELVHSVKIKSDQWQEIAAHFYNGKLRLGIDGQVESLELPAGVVAPKAKEYALKIGIDTDDLNTLLLTGLKIYDWEGEAKLSFADGSFEQTATADKDGKAQIAISAQPALLAYTRSYEQKSMFAQLGGLFIPMAYAQSVSNSKDGCKSSYVAIPDDAEDANIKKADQFMTMLLECFVKPRVEEARISYQTSDGFQDAAVALVEREAIEAIYSVLLQAKTSSVVALNCLDASFTGSNSSAVGSGCDFITSMLAIGDLRDILLQAWHYNLGHLTGTREDYDELTAQLAAVGLLASGSQLLPGAGQTAGVAATAFAASGKIVAKFLKKVGAAGKQAGRLIARKLGRIMDAPDTKIADKGEQLQKMVPLVEASVSLSLIYDENPELFRFMAEAISSDKALDNLVTFFVRYFEKLEKELSAPQASRFPAWFEAVFPSAYAVSGDTKDRFIREFAELVYGINLNTKALTDRERAKLFNDSVDEFLRMPADSFANLPDGKDMEVIRAFSNIRALNPSDSDLLRKFLRMKGYNFGYHQSETFSDADFMKYLAEVDWSKLEKTAPGVTQSIAANVIKKFNGEFNFDKGTAAHLLSILDLAQKGSEKIILRGVEVKDKTYQFAGSLRYEANSRRIDLLVEIDGKLVRRELKNTNENNWKNTLSGYMSGTGDKTDQLRGDLLKYIHDGYTGRQWEFTPALIPSNGLGGIKLDEYRKNPAVIEAMEEEILDYIEELVESPKHSSFMAAALGVKPGSAQWEKKKDELFLAMSGSGPDGIKFVSINPYSKIVN